MTVATAVGLKEFAETRVLQRAPSESPTFELITFGSGGHFARHSIDKTSALIESR